MSNDDDAINSDFLEFMNLVQYVTWSLLMNMATHQKLKSIGMARFIDDIGTSSLCPNPPESLDALVYCYNGTLSFVLNQHKPIHENLVYQQS